MTERSDFDSGNVVPKEAVTRNERYYCSRHVICVPSEGGMLAVNCATNKWFRVANDVVEILAAASGGGVSAQELKEMFPRLNSQIGELLEYLVQSGLLHEGEE